MKRIGIVLLLLLLWSSMMIAQTPVSWTFAFNRYADSVIVTATASIDEGWKIYGTKVVEDGPNNTIFGLDNPDGFNLLGAPIEVTKAHDAYDKVFGENIAYYKEKAVLKQIYVISGGNNILEGFVEYQACNDEECLPPTPVSFKYDISKASITHETKVAALNGDLPIWHTDKKETHVVYTSKDDDTRSKGLWLTFLLAFLGGLAALLTPCVFPMIPFTVSYFTKQSKSRAHGIRSALIYGISIIIIYVLLGTGIVAIFGADSLNAMSTNAWFNTIFFLILVVFAASFMGAFELTLPSSWVNASDKGVDKGGFLGIFFMAFTLALVSFSCTGPIVGTLIVTAASSGNWIAPAVGMFGFSLAIAIPFALFAAFPSWLNSLPKSGGWMNSVKVVLAFIELGLALKFLSIADMVLGLHLLHREVFIALWIVIALLMGLYLLGQLRFPHDSPKSKPSIVGVVLGTISLIFAAYMVPGLWGAPVAFISGFPPPSDYAESPFGVYGNQVSMTAIAIAILCIILVALLFFNLFLLKFVGNREKRRKPIPVYRAFISIITLSLMIYMLPSFSGAPIKIIAWAIPGFHVSPKEHVALPEQMHYGPEGIPVFDDYEAALKYAKLKKKPLFLDFTGVGCVNCRKVEANVWSHNEIKKILSDDYIVVSLQVDIKEELPDSKKYVSPYSGNRIKTVGALWSDLQLTRFGTSSQPFYVIVDEDRNYLGTVKTLDLDVDRYKKWLEDNLEIYKTKKY